MNRQMRRANTRGIDKINAQYGAELTEIPVTEDVTVPPSVARLWRSARLIVIEHKAPGKYQNMVQATLTVQLATGGNPMGIKPSELMDCKRAAGYGELDAIEPYLRDQDTPDMPSDVRVLWVLKGLLPFVHRASEAG